MPTWRIKSPFLRKSRIRIEPGFTRSNIVVLPPAKTHHTSEATLAHFNLSKDPFADSYDPDLFFLSNLHQQAVTALIDAVECNRGLSAFIAEPGAGKTTLLYRILECYSTAAYTAFLPNSRGGAGGLKQALLAELQRMLKHGGGTDRRILIVLDEAHSLTSSELEVVGALSSFKSRTSKLLHFMLAGRPALAGSLSQPPLLDLQSRITVVNRDLHLTPAETGRYINRRLKLSGYSGPLLFTREANSVIASVSQGLPGQINAICAKAISRACDLGTKEISPGIIRDVTTHSTGPLLSLPLRQIDPVNLERKTQDGHGQARPVAVAAPASLTRGRPRRIRLPRIVRGSYQEVLVAGIGAVAVAAICFVVLYALTFGLSSHRSAEVALGKQTDQHPEYQAAATTNLGEAGPRTSNSESAVRENLQARSPIRSGDPNQSLKGDSPRTVTTDDHRETLDKLAALPPVDTSADTAVPASEIPPKVPEPATSDLKMPPLNNSGESARIPISAPVAPASALLSTAETTSPQVTRMVRPTYPSKAKKQKIYGEVVVTGIVGTDGKLRMIATSGPAQLEEAAIRAAQEWRYKPPTLNGNPVESTARIVFNFSQPD
jgi:TonB family protein